MDPRGLFLDWGECGALGHRGRIRRETALENSRSTTWLLLTTENRVGGPERKEFELKPTFPLRLFLRMPRPPQCISASPRKRFTSTNSGSLNTLALVDPLIVDQGPEGSSSSLQWWRRGESHHGSMLIILKLFVFSTALDALDALNAR